MSAEQRLRETLDAFAARVREDLDSRAQALAAELTRAVQDADGAVRAEADRSLAAERRQLDAVLADERAALASLHAAAERDGSAALVRLLDDVRRLDAAPSLTSILALLGQSLRTRAARAAIFIVDESSLKCWSHDGFDHDQAPGDVSIPSVAVVASAVASRAPAMVRAGDLASAPGLPPFLQPPVGQVGLVTPLSVGGDVVALVYAEGAEATDDEVGGASPGARAPWLDEVELVARYACARLESVTSERTVSALTRMA